MNNIRHKNPFALIFLLFFGNSILSPASAEAQHLTTRFYWDTTALTELYNTVSVGFEFRTDKGTRRTEGFLGGRIRWTNLQVRASPGKFDNGQVTFDRRAVEKQGNNLRITLIPRKNPADSQHFSLPVPYVTAIRFKPFADSLKRGIAFDLNVEAVFSSQRIYPLDTADVLLSSDAGSFSGSSLLIPLEDTSTSEVQVKAVYKHNPDLHAEINLPVKKIWDPFQPMPDEESILHPSRERNKRR